MNFFSSAFLILKTILLVFFIRKSFQIKHSTKTAYLDSFKDEQLEYINNIQNYKIQNCSPEQIYIFLRHGSRFPNSKYVKKTQDFLNQVKELRKKQNEVNKNKRASKIDQVYITFHDKPNHGLSELGAKEMYEIGQRFSRRYQELFDHDESSILSNFHIASSDRDRCIDSGRSFVQGLYGDSPIGKLLKQNIILNNTLIRYFDECERYLVEVKKKKKTTHDIVNFLNGPEMTKLKSNFKSRNFIQELEFETKLLNVIFGLCGIEHAHRMDENWCKLFENDEELEILSYFNDLKDYWIKSYGNEINSHVVQYIYKDLIENMDKYVKNHTDKKKVVLRFGHAENIIPLVTVLDLFKDSFPLTYDKFDQYKDRFFKTAIMSPFSSNLAFVLHKCNSPEEMYKVKILVNELPLNMIRAGNIKCDINNNSMCDFENFKTKLENFLKVNLNKSCKLDNNLKNIEL